jgi:glycosyltransferase involved in cell wall biosynthesis
LISAMPLVTVVIPTYNRADLLGEALASVHGQGVPDVEVLVVDDGSTDGGAERRTEEGTRVLRQPHAGPAAARNRGVAEAAGRWVAFLDADDAWTADGLAARLERCAAADAGTAVVYGDATVVGADGEDRGRRISDARSPREGDVADALFRENFVCTSTVIARRDAVLAAGGFRTEFEPAEDYDLWLRLADRGRFAYVARPVARYRVHGGALGADRARMFGAEIRVLEERARTGRRPAGWRSRLARLHYFRGLLTLERERRAARGHFGRCARLRPLSPRAWAFWLATWAPGIGVRGTRRFLERVELH